MKFAITLLALAATALAQSTAVTETAPSQTPTAETTCLSKCAPGDVNCQAVCVGVPNPNAQQMNQTTECVAQCDQGDGSAAATQKYTACRNNCISSYILIGTTAHTPATTASATSAPNVNTINTSTLTGSALSAASSSIAAARSSSSAAAAASSSSSKGGAAPTGVRMAATGGSLGLIVAAFAML